MSLPNDLLLSCVARVSILYYPTLSLVSKSFRSILTSPELYNARSVLGRTESCLYVCLMSKPYLNSSCWFTLCRKPDKTSNNDDTSGYALATVPITHSPRPHIPGLVAVGSDIYSIGVSSSVMILDCMSHTWREAPSLPVEPMGLSSSVLDGKIYVAAGSCEDSSKNLFEVFDTETQTWDPSKPIPCSKAKYDFAFSKSTCIDGKFHLVSHCHHDVIAYSPKEGRWDKVGNELRDVFYTVSYCVVENVLYTNFHGVFKWFDTKPRVWRKLKGLVRLPKFPPSCRIQLADYGGKLAVLWVDQSPCTSGDGYNKDKIWCAEIALEKQQQESCEIWGEVEWFGHVLTVPATCRLEKVLAATL
ncbi:PREDICTED: F-box/kelch-repeat protein At5g51250-like [Camelina sativa]|uniref:F-box/kelch-repeat protein At5g51250-like n=1 Tax=Camelina sativa TaxID=90675 RepID=A0ABM0ZGB7_CAMSA|nr:PREDICTED: F-box/kelch-repeat protein At5g51250-like [Camelina sativa]